ncbi:MAG: ABC transporter ATP-binding protein [Acidaminococcus sp.]|nr:ABC transporter ATP-binding protein [Acidaminococcus sp.]MDD7398109.1 ABC transporter ATP-binding protein [Bacillota bacterium]MDY5345647.1 ABC transporter ATP-binding protein [Eubacteriales bacterium]
MIIAENVTKKYGDNLVLDNLSLKIESGEFVSIMGESGSGKSTLLSVLSGATKFDSGKVILCGKDLATLNQKELAIMRRTELGFVYQFFNLIPTLTVEENILLPIYLRKDNLKASKANMLEITDKMRISDLLNKYPDKISGGEQQRVAIARSILYKPKVLMLDEPTGNLDSRAREDIMELLVALNKEYKITVVQVTHSMETAVRGTRIVKMIDGRVQNEDMPKQIATYDI